MNKIKLTISLFFSFMFCGVFVNASIPTWSWKKNFDGIINSTKYINDYIYIAGNYTATSINIGTITLTNAGGYDGFIAKLDTLGNVIWAKSISGTGDESVLKIEPTFDNNLMIGGSYNSASLTLGGNTYTNQGSMDIFVAKYDLNGNLLFSKSYGDTANNTLKGFCVDYSNNYYLSANSTIKKYLSTGVLQWNQVMNNCSDIFYSKEDTTLVTSGWFVGNMTFAGTTISSVYAGYGTPALDIYMAKMKLNHVGVWFKNISQAGHVEYGYKFYVNSSGHIFYSYETTFWDHTYIYHLDKNGNVLYFSYDLWPYECYSISGDDSYISFYRGDGLQQYDINTNSLVKTYTINPNNSTYGVNIFPSSNERHIFHGLKSIYTSGDTYTFGKLGHDSLYTNYPNQNVSKCISSAINLSSSIVGGVPPYTYSWSPSLGLSSTNTSITSCTATTSTTYTLTVTDSINQIAQNTFIVQVDTPLSPINITSQYPTFCSDSLILFSNTTAISNSSAWRKLNIVNNYWDYLSNAQNVSVSSPGKYAYKYSNVCGYKSDTIEILPTVNLSFTSVDSSICLGDSVTLTASGALNYNWTNGVTNGIPFYPTATQTYNVTGTDANGCIATSSIEIIVNSNPTISSISASNNIICNQGNSILTAYPSNNYCTPTIQYITYTECISNFNFNNEINNTTANIPNYYTYYTLSANVIAGNSYPISITSGNGIGTLASIRTVWIDFNFDGDFDDSGELVFYSGNSSYTVTGNVTIPINVLNGTTRMRVGAKWYGANTPCYNDNYGEYEDYLINISGGINNSITWTPSTFLNNTTGNQVTATNINATTNYIATITNAAGCSASISKTIVVNPVPVLNIYDTICDSQLPYNWNGNVITNAGIYTDTSTSYNGCDSLTKLNLVVNQSTIVSINQSKCSSQLPYYWNGQNLSSSGIYSYTTTNIKGCDSTTNLNLTIFQPTIINLTQTICTSQLPYTWNGQILTTAGTYAYTTLNVNGCDSTTNLTLYVNNNCCTLINYLSMSSIGSSSGTCIWGAASGVIGYNLRYKIVGTNLWNYINNISTNSQVLTGLTSCTPYEFQIQKICTSNITSAFSVSKVFTTTTACSLTSGLTLTSITSNTGNTKWNAVPNATFYKLRYKAVSSPTWLYIPTNITTTNYLLTGLNSGTTYEFQISTNCTAGVGCYSSSKQFTTNPCGIASGLTMTMLGATTATALWTNSTSASSYNLRYKPVMSNSWIYVNGLTSNTYSFTNLAKGMLYEYQVSQVCVGGASAYSASKQFATSPGGLTLNSWADTYAEVKWYEIVGIPYYTLQYRAVGSNTWNIVNGLTTTSYWISNLSPATQYEFQVKANLSSMSASKLFTTSSVCASTYDNTNYIYSVIPLSTPIYGRIETASDIDYYGLKLYTTADLYISLTNLPANYKISLLNANMNLVIDSSDNSGNSSEFMILNSPTIGNSTGYIPVDYILKVQGVGGNYSASQCYTLKVNNNGTYKQLETSDIKKESNQLIKLYPNPTTGEIKLEYSLEEPNNVNVTLYDMTGKVIKEVIKNELHEKGEYSKLINMDSFGITKGMYILKITNGANNFIERIIYED